MTEGSKVSIRGLVDSDYDIPVRECNAVYVGNEREPAKGYDGTRVNFMFNDLENVVCLPGQVYNLPTLVINLGETNKRKTKFGYFGDSLASQLSPEEDIDDCIGKRMHLVVADGLENRPQPKLIWSRDADPVEFPGKMVPVPVWIVTSIEGGVTVETGSSGQSTAEWAEENLIGKARADFNKWAYADTRIRKDKELQRSITDKSFISALIQLGKVEENEDGVFQVPV